MGLGGPGSGGEPPALGPRAAPRAPTPRPAPLVRQVVLKLRRVCAVPSCATSGGRHLLQALDCCALANCSATPLVGGKHSPLLASCDQSPAARQAQVPLWPTGGSKYSVGAWWGFPEDMASIMPMIALPAHSQHRTLTRIELQARH